ncbi:hypothetical protein RA29_05945 [Tateyamaria sp. ANG-S1]|nr:hypothetical protein RA29_05945 [Tateyamaria sp. ANG-S1]
MQSETLILTKRAVRYMTQMNAHFGSRVHVVIQNNASEIKLPFGTALLTASDDQLEVCVSGDVAEIGRLERVIGSHLERFAFRDNPKILWRRTYDTD